MFQLQGQGSEFTTAPRNSLTELSQGLQSRNTREKNNESVLGFLDSHNIFSNLHKAPFQFDGTQYSCME